ncbi:MAG: post-segregation antitoxin (ccd killing protein) [Candidatus Poriferisodalaceae bacterium]|jgi:post-segregation antitoxin (ccd killing protein)
MARTRISTTVDSDLLDDARKIGVGVNDAELVDAALSALLAGHRRVQIDEAYEDAYSAQPIDEPDAWGSDLASFRDVASRS